MDNLLVIARSHSQDPEQEKLREHKDLWNRVTSVFIGKLIAFKRGMNGRGDPKSGIPSSTIKMPLPNEVGSLIHQLMDEFNSLSREADNIIQEQENYSKTRHQPSFHTSASLISESSWWGSRWLARNHKYNKDDKSYTYYVRMLNVAAQFSRLALDLENVITSSDPNFIVESVYLLGKMILGKFNGLATDINLLSEIAGVNKNETPITITPKSDVDVPEIKSSNTELLLLKNELQHAQTAITTLVYKEVLDQKYNEIVAALKKKVAIDLADNSNDNVLEIKEQYQNLLVECKSAANLPEVNSFEELSKQLLQEHTKQAHNALTRFLHRKILNLPMMGGEDREAKRRLSEIVRIVINQIDELMNALETQSNVQTLICIVKNIDLQLQNLIRIITDAARLQDLTIRHQKDLGKDSNLIPISERHIRLLNKMMLELQRIMKM